MTTDLPRNYRIHLVSYRGKLYFEDNEVWSSKEKGISSTIGSDNSNCARIDKKDAKALVEKKLTFKGTAAIELISNQKIHESQWGEDSAVSYTHLTLPTTPYV